MFTVTYFGASALEYAISRARQYCWPAASDVGAHLARTRGGTAVPKVGTGGRPAAVDVCDVPDRREDPRTNGNVVTDAAYVPPPQYVPAMDFRMTRPLADVGIPLSDLPAVPSSPSHAPPPPPPPPFTVADVAVSCGPPDVVDASTMTDRPAVGDASDSVPPEGDAAVDMDADESVPPLPRPAVMPSTPSSPPRPLEPLPPLLRPLVPLPPLLRPVAPWPSWSLTTVVAPCPWTGRADDGHHATVRLGRGAALKLEHLDGRYAAATAAECDSAIVVALREPGYGEWTPRSRVPRSMKPPGDHETAFHASAAGPAATAALTFGRRDGDDRAPPRVAYAVDVPLALCPGTGSFARIAVRLADGTPVATLVRRRRPDRREILIAIQGVRCADPGALRCHCRQRVGATLTAVELVVSGPAVSFGRSAVRPELLAWPERRQPR